MPIKYKNIYFHADKLSQMSSPGLLFYQYLKEAKIIDSACVFCDKYTKELSNFELPIFHTHYLYMLLYKKLETLFIIESLSSADSIKHLLPNACFLMITGDETNIGSIKYDGNSITQINTTNKDNKDILNLVMENTTYDKFKL